MICTVEQKDRIVSERFYNCCDFVVLKPGDNFLSKPDHTLIGYCKTDYVGWFFDQCRENSSTRYVLITHESDYSITEQVFQRKPPNIVMWYGQNIDFVHPMLQSIPIGSAVSTWIGTSEHTEISDHPDFCLIPEQQEKKEHINLAYMDFGIWTNSKHRRAVHDYFKTKPWVSSKPCDISPSEYKQSGNSISTAKQCSNIYHHKFVISPIGNGYDCGRNWLSLYLGAIPVIPWHKNIDFYKDLPFVVYNDIEEVTEEFLNEKYDEISSKEYTLDKAKVSYWHREFLKSKERFDIV